MALFLLVFAVCMLVICSMVGILLMSRTPRYRTDPAILMEIFDKALEGTVSENEWNAVINYPIRHDDYLDGVRRRALHLMQEYGRPWQAARGGSLLSREGREELAELRAHLAAHAALKDKQHFDA